MQAPLVGSMEHLIATKGSTITYRPTPFELSTEAKEEAARLAGERRKRSRSGDQQARQPSRQTASEVGDGSFPEIDDYYDDGVLEDFAQPPGYVRWQDLASNPYSQRVCESETDWGRLDEALYSKSLRAKPTIAARRVGQGADRKRELEVAACSE